MAGTGRTDTSTVLVAAGILAVFCVFLLFLVIPAHLLLFPVIIGAGVLMVVAVFFMFRAPRPVMPEALDPVSSSPRHVTAGEPAVMPGNPYYRRSPLGYRLAVLVAGWFGFSFFWYEIWPRVSSNNPVPLPIIAFQLILILTFCSMLWRCRDLPPAMDGLRQTAGRAAAALNAVIPVLREGFGMYISIAVLLNGGLAVLLLAAADGVLSISFTGANGFIVFLLFAFGNLLIFSLVLLRMERIWSESAGKPGKPSGIPDPATRYAVMTILALVFTALFFAVPMLAFSTGIIGPEVHDREILLVVERVDPAHVTVTLAGGKDAGTLVALVAEEYEKIPPSYFDQGKSDRQFITEMQVGPKTGTIPLPNGTRFTVVGLCNSTCVVDIHGYFLDGKEQEFYNAVV